MRASARSYVPVRYTQHLLFNRVGVHLSVAKAHADPAQMQALLDDIRQMYADYELAKALLRTLAKLGKATL